MARRMITTRLEEDLVLQMKYLAAELRKPLNDLLEEAIREFLGRHTQETTAGGLKRYLTRVERLRKILGDQEYERVLDEIAQRILDEITQSKSAGKRVEKSPEAGRTKRIVAKPQK